MAQSSPATLAIQQALQAFFKHYPAPHYIIAYSGGLDSHVLLHACATLNPRPTLRVIHINHGLQHAASDWAQHCQHVCQALGLPCTVLTVSVPKNSHMSLEAAARQARYAALAEQLQANEGLLTAHHQDDQAETFLLNALRGAGGLGLAAMPACRAFHAGYLGRPLLHVSRAELAAYAAEQGLSFIEDPSNAAQNFDRNFLRHSIMPHLQQRWPSCTQTLARAAQWQGENQQLLDTLLAQQLPAYAGTQAQTLSVQRLLSAPLPLQKALLRHWLQQLNLPLPSAKKLQHILSDVLAARADAMPCVQWTGAEVRRYRDDLYALKPLSPHDPKQVIVWDDRQAPLYVPSLQWTLSVAEWDYLAAVLASQPERLLTVRFRQGGEVIQRRQRPNVSLKQLLQEAGIPPWQRSRWPLLYWGEQLVVIPHVFYLPAVELVS